MTRILAFVGALFLAIPLLLTAPFLAVDNAAAGGRHGAAAGGRHGGGASLSQHPKSGYYRGGPQVRGFRRRVGGYSYSYQDAITDPRDGSVFQDPELFRQSDPFDSGYFFDSNVGGPISNSSPYLN